MGSQVVSVTLLDVSRNDSHTYFSYLWFRIIGTVTKLLDGQSRNCRSVTEHFSVHPSVQAAVRSTQFPIY